MSYFTKLMQDAQPKADSITIAVDDAKQAINNNKVIKAAKVLGYKGLVSTVGVGLCLSRSTVEKAKSLSNKAWSKVEALADSK